MYYKILGTLGGLFFIAAIATLLSSENQDILFGKIVLLIVSILFMTMAYKRIFFLNYIATAFGTVLIGGGLLTNGINFLSNSDIGISLMIASVHVIGLLLIYFSVRNIIKHPKSSN
jgi:predicted neutral ceramidase superfamily lipid hydrolase